MTFKSSLPTLGLAGVVAMAATAGPAVADELTFQTFIPVPADAANMQPGGAFSSFDISFADPVTGNIFVADRSNASVDIFSGSSLQFLGRATGFTGQQATNSLSGADGVLTVTSGGVTTLYAGDGDSTLKVFNATNPATPTLVSSISTGGNFRLDEMAFSPLTHQVLAANNADAPAYATLFSTTNGHPPVAVTTGPITVPILQGGSRPAAWSSRRGIRPPERSSFPFRRWPGKITQVGSLRSALLALSCERSISQAWASHRARRPDSPLVGAAT
jgi:hypothetical protein